MRDGVKLWLYYHLLSETLTVLGRKATVQKIDVEMPGPEIPLITHGLSGPSSNLNYYILQ